MNNTYEVEKHGSSEIKEFVDNLIKLFQTQISPSFPQPHCKMDCHIIQEAPQKSSDTKLSTPIR